MPESNLSEYLAELRGERLLYQPNPGNAGDSLIAAATLDLFQRLGLDVELMTPATRDVRDRIVLHGGGGGFWNNNPVVVDFLRRFASVARRVVLLPQTITGHADLLESLPARVHLFCRDRVSHEYLSGLRLRAGCFLDHDVALQLPAREWLARQRWWWLGARAPDRFIKGLRRWRVAALAHPQDQPLRVWRGDMESSRQPEASPPAGADLSRAFALGTRRAAFCQLSAWFFLRFIGRFQAVETDRLHVAIGGALLDRPVTMHPNRYFKNRAVYEHSLRGRFPQVRWAPEHPGRPRPGDPLPTPMNTSWAANDHPAFS